MKIIIILIVVFALIIILYKIRQKRAQATMNPIDSIVQNGTMGFLIGDSKAFTLSRIKHLGMATNEDFDKYKMCSSFGYDKIEVAHNIYNHIKEISFDFKNDKLQQISILFDKKPDEISEFFNIVKHRIEDFRLGEPTFEHDGIAKWNNKISLYYDVQDTEHQMLFLFIADYI